MKNNIRLSPVQWRITVLCVIAYSVLYFMRLNISLALTGMESSFQASPEELGIISSAFFWCYAFGQLIFGFLGDRLPVRYMVFTGLFGSGLVNLAVSLLSSLPVAVALWALNGVFQSMLWSPIMRCVAQHFDGEKRVVVSFYLSITQVIGYMVAWAGSYLIDRYFGWRFVFAVPAILGLVYAVIWLILFRYSSEGEPVARAEKKGSSLIRQPVLLTFLGVIAVFSILFGLVKSSIDTWLPTMINDIGHLPESGIVITLLLVPLVNFAGILLSKLLVSKLRGDIYKTILIAWGGALLISGVALALFEFNPLVFVVFLAILFGFVYGLTPLFTSFIPLDFAKWNCVSTVTGFVDFAIYVGAGITGVVSGMVIGDGDSKNWSALSLYWLIILGVGMLVAIGVFFWHWKLRKQINREESEWD